jgi:hypothetical protein
MRQIIPLALAILLPGCHNYRRFLSAYDCYNQSTWCSLYRRQGRKSYWRCGPDTTQSPLRQEQERHHCFLQGSRISVCVNNRAPKIRRNNFRKSGSWRCDRRGCRCGQRGELRVSEPGEDRPYASHVDQFCPGDARHGHRPCKRRTAARTTAPEAPLGPTQDRPRACRILAPGHRYRT